MKAYNRKGEPVQLADGEILPDGFSIRVPSFLVDGIPQAMTTENVRIVDSAGRASGSRPGFLLDNSDNEFQARVAYDLMVARNTSAWRGPNSTLISDATTPALAREAMIRHSENAWRTPVQARDAAHVTIPGGDDDDDPETARKKYINKIENAWRETGGVKFGSGFGG